MSTIFYFCCDVVRYIAAAMGLTYEQVNTILFIYGEPLILCLSALLVAVVARKWYAALYPASYALATFPLWNHYYPMGLHGACVQAYKDLEVLGSVTGLGYIKVNILLFIVLFLAVLLFNGLLTYLAFPKPLKRAET